MIGLSSASGSSRNARRCVVAWRLVVLMAVVLASRGEAAGVIFERLTTADGLPDAVVEAAARDRHGYLWFATQGGLVRHEGLELRVLRHDPDDPTSLPGNNILSLLAGSDGHVWAAVSGHGLVRLEGTRIVDHWASATQAGPLQGQYIWSMAEACDGSVWALYATDGLVRIEPETAQTRHFPAGERGLPDSGFGMALIPGAGCRMWLLRLDGLYHFDPAEPEVFRPVLAASQTDLPLLISMLLLEDGTAWLGGTTGLQQFKLPRDPLNGEVEIGPFHPTPTSVATIAEDREQRIWLGLSHGIMLFDPESGTMESMTGDGESFPPVQINDISVGAEGEIWFMTADGVARLPPGWEGVRVYRDPTPAAPAVQVTSVARHGDEIWLGSTDRDVLRLDPSSGAMTRLDPPIHSGNSTINGLHVTPERIWASKRTKVVVRDRSSGRDRVVIDADDEKGDLVVFLSPADAGRVWVGTNGDGLLLFDADGERVQRWHRDAAPQYRLDASTLRMIRRGPDGHWWLLGLETLLRQAEDGRFEVLHQADQGFQAMEFQGDGVWLASESVLEFFRIEQGFASPQKRYTAGDGLPAGRIQSMVAVRGDLWLLTSIGLARLEPALDQFRRFPIEIGGAGMSFMPRSLALLEDGQFVAGTQDGAVRVDPRRLTPGGAPPPVWVTTLRAGDRRIGLGPGQDVLPKLQWHENSVEFAFRALSYADPARNRYRLRLLGWDRTWREQVGQQTRFYSNLPPGEYRFEVQAAGVDGIWNWAGDAVSFQIAPPLWRSNAAWALYALLAVTGIAAGWRANSNRRKRVQALREARTRQELSDRQRRFLERLNQSLEPDALAGSIVSAAAELTGARPCRFGYVHAEFPDQVWDAQHQQVERAEFDAALKGDRRGDLLRVSGAREALAALWLPNGIPTQGEGERARLELLLQTAGQVLENARLLQEVRHFARQAEQASAAKSEFLAVMSHEIRTPLHGLMGMMEVLEQGLKDPGNLDMLRTMRASGRQLQRILNDVLDLSRIEAGRIELEPRPFVLPLMLERVLDLHAPNALAAGLAIRLRIAHDLAMMAIGDSDRISQVIGNLLNNAIKFTNEGAVELEAYLDHRGWLVLAVSDTGSGIESAFQKELFETFSRAEQVATRHHSGAGLGLAICRRLVEAMGGGIDVSSQPGRGSRFSVRLPLQGMRRRAPSPIPALENLRVRLALAAPDARVIRRLLRRWGIEMEPSPSAPGPANLLKVLIFDRRQLSGAALQHQLGDLVAALEINSGAADLPPDACPASIRRIRAPLTEQRLLGALLDLAMAGPP